ncbi:conserved hypothetical protein [Candidatus Terasakiella magnetica]|uniref:Class I SAM-dependent methyltransferase n=1 Tax=Candidatus Terasakiella magnetica TaxID=1867952 RepID=A0A1C3RKS5_9PROT|nr:class I SAM-dependent methyltransferase [Candidatus Terasakiella magnetica]SCA57863.1 conserved hypothetical protein [Candidatus Terasakiella magnetica]
MHLVPNNRKQILPFLPQNGRVIEIGVAKGEFSHEILLQNNPKELHLIDPWEFQQRDDYSTDANNVEDNEQEQRFQDVQKRFQSMINAGRVHMHRDYSTNVADQFEDKSCDWIFIDGLHSYEGVKADLEAFHMKIKDDGLILGHDFTNHAEARRMKFGVVEAVNEFVEKYNYQFVLMTWENYPTYVLSRTPDSPVVQHLLGSCFMTASSAINLPDFPDKMKFEHRTVFMNDQARAIPTFTLKDDD